MQLEYETQYFWRKPRIASRGRFNLLLLEYGEIFYENLSVFKYPLPTDKLRFAECDALKVKGRLHICSRSIIFEPLDVKLPLLKFPFKSITCDLEALRLKPDEVLQCSITPSGFAMFRCSGFFEMKDNDKVGPYKYVDSSQGQLQNDAAKAAFKESSFVFALVHTDINAFFSTIQRLRNELFSNNGEGLISLRHQHLSQKHMRAVSFDSSLLLDFHEQLLFPVPINAVRVGPLVLHPGGLMVTNSRIYFQPSNLNNIGDSVQHFEVKNIRKLFARRYLLRQTGVEIFFADGSSNCDSEKSLSSVYFVFESTTVRDQIVAVIENLSPSSNKACTREASLQEMVKKWQRKEVSNFDYLLYLNSEADRSFSDLTQYPIMPHIISDYQSRKLDLNKAETFRDLSKPVGALNPQRLSFFRERHNSMSTVSSDSSSAGTAPFPPPFLYGTHYSTPGYVLYYLVRVAPEHMLCLQNGKFDAPDRMFYSVAGMFSSCLSNPADLKELIPEFFEGEGEFLCNSEGLSMGRRCNGERVDDVELPPWAKSPKDFIKKSRQAMESDYVSDRLHHWIDLIFGYKQRGEEALLADNLFYYLTYEGALDLDSDISPASTQSKSALEGSDHPSRKMMEREAIDVQIQEFGQTPTQLFSSPHPRRNDVTSPVAIKAKETSREPTNSKEDTASPSSETSIESKQKQSAHCGLVEVAALDNSSSSRSSDRSSIAVISSSESKNSTSKNDERGSNDVNSERNKNNSNSSNNSNNSNINSSSSGDSKHRDNRSLTLNTPINDDQSSSHSGMIILGDDFRAEVTRELLAQERNLHPEECSSPTSTSLGTLIVKLKGHITPLKDIQNSGSQGNVIEESDKSDTRTAYSLPLSPMQARSRIQSLWGTISEKTSSIIGPCKERASPWLTPVAGAIRRALPSSPLGDSHSQKSSDLADVTTRRGVETFDLVPNTPQSCVHISMHLSKLHQLIRKMPIAGISALQVPHSDGRGRILVCATSRDATVNVLLSELPPDVKTVDPSDTRDTYTGWRSFENSDSTRGGQSSVGGLEIVSTFVAGHVSPLPTTIFSPMGLLPHVLSAFSTQQSSASFDSSCRLSTDASRVLISSQKGLYCSLYR